MAGDDRNKDENGTAASDAPADAPEDVSARSADSAGVTSDAEAAGDTGETSMDLNAAEADSSATDAVASEASQAPQDSERHSEEEEVGGEIGPDGHVPHHVPPPLLKDLFPKKQRPVVEYFVFQAKRVINCAIIAFWLFGIGCVITISTSIFGGGVTEIKNVVHHVWFNPDSLNWEEDASAGTGSTGGGQNFNAGAILTSLHGATGRDVVIRSVLNSFKNMNWQGSATLQTVDHWVAAVGESCPDAKLGADAFELTRTDDLPHSVRCQMRVSRTHSQFVELFQRVDQHIWVLTRDHSIDLATHTLPENLVPAGFFGRALDVGALGVEAQLLLQVEREQAIEQGKQEELIETFILMIVLGSLGSLVYMIRELVTFSHAISPVIFLFRPLFGALLAVAIFILDVGLHTLVSDSGILGVRIETLYVLGLASGLLAEGAYATIGRVGRNALKKLSDGRKPAPSAG